MELKPRKIHTLKIPAGEGAYIVYPLGVDDADSLLELFRGAADGDQQANNNELYKIALGPVTIGPDHDDVRVFDRMAADKVPYSDIAHAGLTAAVWQNALIRLGGTPDAYEAADKAAEEAWLNGVNGADSPPAPRRSTPRKAAAKKSSRR